MHLKYEAKALIISILLPILFLIWLLTALLYEGLGILNVIINIYI
jgi:cytochrome c oxidase subunit IV